MKLVSGAVAFTNLSTRTCTLETQQDVGCMGLVTCSLSQGHMIFSSKHVVVCGRGLEPMTSSGTHTDDLLMKVLLRRHTRPVAMATADAAGPLAGWQGCACAQAGVLLLTVCL